MPRMSITMTTFRFELCRFFIVRHAETVVALPKQKQPPIARVDPTAKVQVKASDVWSMRLDMIDDKTTETPVASPFWTLSVY